MQRIKYRVLGYMDSYNPDTEETEQVEVLSHVDIPYSADNLAIAQRDAYNGEYTIEDDEQPEPEDTESGDSVWDELDAAYQAGYEEGYTEGVNSAYDQ